MLLYWVTAGADIEKWNKFNVEEATLESLENTFKIKLHTYDDAMRISLYNIEKNTADSFQMVHVTLKNLEKKPAFAPYTLINKNMVVACTVYAWDVKKPSMGKTRAINDTLAEALENAEKAKIKFDQLSFIKSYQSQLEKLNNEINDLRVLLDNTKKDENAKFEKLKEENQNEISKALNQKEKEFTEKLTKILKLHEEMKAAEDKYKTEKDKIIKDLQLEIKNRESQIETLQGELNKIKKGVAEFDKEKSKNKDEIKQVAQELTQRESELNQKVNELNGLKLKLSSQESETKFYQDQSSNYYSQILNLTEDLNKIKRQHELKVEKLKNKSKEQAEKIVSEYNLKIEELNKQLKINKETFESERDSLNYQHINNLEEKNNIILGLENELTEITEEVKKLKNSNQSNIIEAVKSKEIELTNEISKLKSQLNQDELNFNLEKQKLINSYTSSQNNQSLKIYQLKEKLKTFKSEKAHEIQELKAINQQDRAKAQEAINQLNKKISDLNDQLRHKEIAYNTEKQKSAREFKFYSDTTQEKINQLTADLNQIKYQEGKNLFEKDVADKKIKTLEGKILDLEKTLKEKENKYNSETEILYKQYKIHGENLQSQINSYVLEIEKIKSQYIIEINKIEILNKEEIKNAVIQKEKELQIQIEALNNQLQILNDNLLDLKNQKANAEHDVETLNEELKDKNKAHAKKMQELNLEIERLKTEKIDLKEQLDELNETTKSYDEAIEDAVGTALREFWKKVSRYGKTTLGETPKKESFNSSPSFSSSKKPNVNSNFTSNVTNTPPNVISLQGPKKSKQNYHDTEVRSYDGLPIVETEDSFVESANRIETEKTLDEKNIKTNIKEVKVLKRKSQSKKPGILNSLPLKDICEIGASIAVGITYSYFGGVEETINLIHDMVYIPARNLLLPTLTGGLFYSGIKASEYVMNKFCEKPKKQGKTENSNLNKLDEILEEDPSNENVHNPRDSIQDSNIITPQFNRGKEQTRDHEIEERTSFQKTTTRKRLQ